MMQVELMPWEACETRSVQSLEASENVSRVCATCREPR